MFSEHQIKLLFKIYLFSKIFNEIQILIIEKCPHISFETQFLKIKFNI